MNLSSFIWSVADLLRGGYKPHEYGQVILPFTVLRRMDCVLEPTKKAVLKEAAKRGHSATSVNPFLTRAAGTTFYNTSPMDLKAIVGDQDNIAINLEAYVRSFSPNVKDIFARFKLQAQIDRLAGADLLYLVTEKFSKIDLHPDKVSNADMGTIFEELIRKFAELSNETAGEHFTPREVIRLMVNLIFAEDDEALSMPGVVRTVRNLRRSYDFAQFIDAGSNIADRIDCVSQSSQVPGHVGNNKWPYRHDTPGSSANRTLLV
jgi:type I restriction enzyme M protein